MADPEAAVVQQGAGKTRMLSMCPRLLQRERLWTFQRSPSRRIMEGPKAQRNGFLGFGGALGLRFKVSGLGVVGLRAVVLQGLLILKIMESNFI